MQPVVFLDRDNTLIANDGDLGDPARVTLLDGVPEGLRRLRDAGYRLVVVTNQGGVARGRYEEEDVDRVHREVAGLVDLAADRRGLIDRFYYCPFHPDAVVEGYRREHPWRKPQPGMLLQASRDLGIDLQSSWMVGDQPRDVQAGAAAGCRTILIGRGRETDEDVSPTANANDFSEAVDIVLASGRPQRHRGDASNELAQLRRAIEDLNESTRPRGTGTARMIGAGLMIVAPLPFVAGLIFLDEPQTFFAWMLVTVVLMLAAIGCLLLERR
ncbi:MAG: HAD-IIIA family hydrolase [Planctomycetia bacterium]|jgi:D-glycero-D-manno-heptose 1,7-bisphosphate phosphatase|nr:HAD-IIIA family hydrolase [Planctomycetia bacterium]